MIADALIQVENVTKTYGYRAVVKKLSLDVVRGQFVALLGPNGSGKSTLLRMVAGLTKPTAGSIRVGGWAVPGEAAAVRAQIGMVGHKTLLYEALTARENLRFFGQLYGLSLDDEALTARLEVVGLRRFADQMVRTYSRGMQQRLSIARALLHDPAVLLFDEPYTGLDQDASALLDETLTAAAGEGRTVLMSTHQLERAARLADHIVILSKGAVVYSAPATQTDAQSLVRTYADVTGMATAR